MQSFFSNKMGVLVGASFLFLILLVPCMQNMAKKLQESINMVKYIEERGPVEPLPEPPAPEELLPGYTLLTIEDYNEILRSIQEENTTGTPRSS